MKQQFWSFIDETRMLLMSLINPHGTWDFKKTVKKVGINTLIVFITGTLTVYAEEPKVIALAPVLWALLDYLKHRKPNTNKYKYKR